MINSFAHKGLKKFFLTGSLAGIQAKHAERLRLILAQLNQARTVEDMKIPTLALHELKGEKKPGPSPCGLIGVLLSALRMEMQKLLIMKIIIR
jgi:plasmid maintenance system killer protein